MSSRETSPKHRLLGHIAALARALGHEHRLELLEILGQGERTVEALAARSGQPFANTSQHLQLLRRTGLVRDAAAGQARRLPFAGRRRDGVTHRPPPRGGAQLGGGAGDNRRLARRPRRP